MMSLLFMVVIVVQASFQFANVTHVDFQSVVIGEHKPLLQPRVVPTLAVWRNIIVTGHDRVIRMWNAATGEVCRMLLFLLDLCVAGDSVADWAHWFCAIASNIE